MKKLISMAVLCFCMVPSTSTSAQDNLLGAISQNLIIGVSSGYDTTAQSFTLEEGSFVQSISAPVFSRYHPTDHPGTLTILEGDGPYGEVLHEQPVYVKGLNKFYGDDTLQTMTNPQIEWLWVDVQNRIDLGVWTLDSVATEFPVGVYLPAGEYTFMIALDTNVVNQNGTRWIASMGATDNPYTGGRWYYGLNMFLHSNSLHDMAFKVKYRHDISTTVSEFSVPIHNGLLVVPDSWTGSSLLVTDVLGREHASFATLRGGETISVVPNQVAIITLTTLRGERKTAKVFVPY